LPPPDDVSSVQKGYRVFPRFTGDRFLVVYPFGNELHSPSAILLKALIARFRFVPFSIAWLLMPFFDSRYHTLEKKP